MTDFARLLALLKGSEVEFIVIGGYAATAHGNYSMAITLSAATARG